MSQQQTQTVIELQALSPKVPGGCSKFHLLSDLFLMGHNYSFQETLERGLVITDHGPGPGRRGSDGFYRVDTSNSPAPRIRAARRNLTKITGYLDPFKEKIVGNITGNRLYLEPSVRLIRSIRETPPKAEAILSPGLQPKPEAVKPIPKDDLASAISSLEMLKTVGKVKFDGGRVTLEGRETIELAVATVQKFIEKNPKAIEVGPDGSLSLVIRV